MPGFAPLGDLALGEIADDVTVASWFEPWADPAIRTRRGLRASAQQFLAFDTLPFVSFAWFAPLSEPPRLKQGLRAALQRFFAAPPQLRPTPTTTATLSALETKDTFLGATRNWNRVTTAEIGVTATISPVAQIGVAVPVAITSARIAIL